MESAPTTSSVRMAKIGEHAAYQGQPEPLSAPTGCIIRLTAALQSLDDRTLSQIGIERCEIERFAHAEVAHGLAVPLPQRGSSH